MQFRELDTEEEAKFRKWARDNYRLLEPINGVWHPVVQQECALMNKEASDAYRADARGLVETGC